ncbi:MAG: hypothetical protein AB8B55_17790 [Mariniblastus sp.]
MATYLIAQRDTEELETAIFESDAGDAVAVFTDQKHAQAYIDDAGWQSGMVVAELDEVQFMEWLILCYRSGVELMATDPRRREQESGLKVSTLNIEAQLAHAGSHIFQVAQRDF